MKEKIQKKQAEKSEIAEAKSNAEKICADKDCCVHGGLKVRGKIFEGTVIRKFPKRVVIQFERQTYVKKYERYARKRTKIHARLSTCMEDQISVGDYVKVQECRPLSKIIHFTVIEKIRDADKEIKLQKRSQNKGGKKKLRK